MTTPTRDPGRANPSRSLPWALCVAMLLSLLPLARAEGPKPAVVVVVPIHGELSDSMIVTLQRAIDVAEEEEAAFLLVDIDTPGGAVTTMEALGDRLDRSKVPPVAYVTREALSAGAYIALACTRIYTEEQAQIGSSMPIFILPGLGVIPPDIDEGMKDLMEKQLSALRSKFRNRAELHDRPGMASLAEGMVDPSLEILLVGRGNEEIPMTRVEFDDVKRTDPNARIIRTLCPEGTLLNLTSREAFDLGLTDGIVLSREEVLGAIGVPDARVIQVWPNWSEQMVGKLQNIRWILIGIGVLLLALEFFFFPGTWVAGVAGATFLAVVFLSNYLVGLAELPEILLIILGIGLLAVEFFLIPGFGAFGIAGITAIAIGVLFSFLPFLVPDSPIETELMSDTLKNFAILIVGTVAFILGLSKFVVRKTPFYRGLVLDTGVDAATLEGSGAIFDYDTSSTTPIGTRGVATTDLRPAGKVDVNGNLLDARTEGGYVERGVTVEVVFAAPNHLVVRPVTT